jgi:hypothetical protein
MKSLVIALGLVIVFTSLGISQKSKVTEEKFKVFGNCGMCKDRIEKAVKIKEVKYAKWDKKTKILTVAFLSPSIMVDSLKKRIAAVGHDTEKFKAPDSVYSALPGCCLYRNNSKTH